jgi:hypothetical protein
MVLQRALSAFEELVDPVATPISTGLLHETYAIRDVGDRQFILQRINPVFSPGINHNIRAVTEHLAERGVETFRLISCKGQPFADLGTDGSWRLMTRIPGISFDRPEGADQLREAGRLVASFHRALFDFEAPLHPIGFPYHDTSQHLEDLSLALRECGGHVFHSEISRLADEIFESAAALPSFAELPQRVIHGDLKFNNLLFEPATEAGASRPVALIDLDTISRMPLAFDWGDALRSWCNRKAESEPEADLDLSLVEAACDGLMTAFETGPGAPELESLGWGLETISLELSARFATDALRECYFAWDQEKYERAGAHNRDRALGQFDLFRQARETHDTRARRLSS